LKEQQRYEILNSLPGYGPMYIPITDDAHPYYSEGFVIRFLRSDGTNWVANFKPGWTSLNKVFDFPNHELIVVFAGGLGYIMNPNSEKPKMIFGNTIDAVFQIDDGSLIFSDGISIQILDNKTGEFWKSERISWDEIKNLNLSDNILFGLSSDPTNSKGEWIEFSLNIKTKEIKGGSYRLSMDQNPHILKIQFQADNQITSWWDF
jgi:hypothetical protein